MRILLCLNRDFMSNLALNQLWPALDGYIFDIVLSNCIGRKNAPKAAEIEEWAKLENALIEGSLFPMLDQRQPVAGQFQSFAQLAKLSQSGAIREFASINEVEGVAYVKQFQPDVIISIRFGQIFKAPLIAIPPLGILNLHSGILPAYRGVLATFWALLNQEAEIGCTLHYITDNMIDTGAIIGIHKIPASRQRSLLWNVASLYEGGTTMLANIFASLSSGKKINALEQNIREGKYYTYPTRPHIVNFLEQGNILFSQEDYSELFNTHYGIKPAFNV